VYLYPAPDNVTSPSAAVADSESNRNNLFAFSWCVPCTWFEAESAW